MRVVVCIKQVMDPEAPMSMFTIDPETMKAIPPKGTPPVLSPYDENALEAAIRVKEATGAEVIALSLGSKLAKAVLRKALAVGAVDLILLEDDAFEDLDSYSSAFVLSEAIKRIGLVDLVLCGRQAADTDAGQVGSVLAGLLGIPCVTLVRKIDKTADGFRFERLAEGGYDVVEVVGPVVVTVTNEVGELRMPVLKDILAANKKPLTTWKASDLGLDSSLFGASAARVKIVNLVVPKREVKCEIIGGGSAAEAGKNLAHRLRDAQVL